MTSEAIMRTAIGKGATALPTPERRIQRGCGRGRGRCRPAVALAVAGLLALAGCASSLPAEVTTFHQLPARAQWQGRSFALVTEPAQQDNLEFANYAQSVRQALVRQGLVEAPAQRVADYAVSVRYGTVQSQGGSVRSGSSVGVGVGGGGFSLGGLGIGLGIGIPIGGGQRTSARYRHELGVDLNDDVAERLRVD